MSIGSRRVIYFVAGESALLVFLLTLAALVLRGSITSEEVSRFGGWWTAAALFACFAVYWAMQTLGRSQAPFWLMAIGVVLAQGLAIWGHNALEWSQFFGMEADGESARSLIRDTFLFLVSLVGLMVLHRIIGLRRLDGLLLIRRVGVADRNRILFSEGLVLVGLMTGGALLALLLVLIASTLGSHQDVLSLSPWSIATVGGSAAVLFVSAIFVWLTRR